MSIFSHFPQVALDIVAPDGTVRCTTAGHVSEKSITIPDTSITVEPGDEIRRKLPNGREEVFLVKDARYADAFHVIPAHYEISIARKGAFPSRTAGHHINVSGQNARVNIGSADHSKNFAVGGDIFDSLKSAVQTSISDNAKVAELTAAIDEMKRQKGGPGFAVAYQKFISVLADHITVVAPLLPALTTLLGAQ